MRYLNLESQRTIRTPEFLTSPADEQVAWLLAIAFCCEKENGGVIVRCRDWQPRDWLALVAVDADIIKRNSQLWTWRDADLELAFYPTKQEETYQKQCEAGRETQRKLQERRKAGKGTEPEGNEREGKGKEGSPFRSPDRSPGSVPPHSPRAAGQGRHRNPVDTYAGAEDYDDMRGSR